MKRQSKNSTTPVSEKASISLGEIVLCAGYVLAVVLIPESWLDTGIGAIAFAIASKVNPYLTEPSIAIAADPTYFVHCHLLATLILAPGLFVALIARNGGSKSYEEMFLNSIEERSLAFLWGLYAILFVLLNSMAWMVDYPLSRTDRGVWVAPFGVAFFAFVTGGLLALLFTAFFLLKVTVNKLFEGAQ